MSFSNFTQPRDVTDLNGQKMDGSSTDTQQLEHRPGTTVTVVMRGMELRLVPAVQLENGFHSCLFANVSKELDMN